MKTIPPAFHGHTNSRRSAHWHWLLGLCLIFAGGPLLGQGAVQINGMDVADGTGDDATDASAPYVIFSNLGSRDNLYDTTPLFDIAIVGREVNQTQEQWDAIRFIPKVDVQATVLEAAVGYTSGTKLVQLGIYSNNDLFEVPDTLLPGGQGSTNDIPDLGECCQLARVTLPGTGVTLTAGTIYWLVASTDDVHGVSFKGGWQLSHSAERAVLAPGSLPWIVAPGQWPAGRIRGTRLELLGPLDEEKQRNTRIEDIAAARGRKIFSTLNPLFPEPYLPNSGFVVEGDDTVGNVEVWLALPFTPRAGVQAQTLSVAIGHTSGTNQMNLGIYSDSGGVPSSPLPGGEGSLTNLPETGDCCDLATLNLAGEGVALTRGTKYWLVASPDNVNAPDFSGLWQNSTNNIGARLYPQASLWTPFSGYGMAAQITGQSQ